MNLESSPEEGSKKLLKLFFPLLLVTFSSAIYFLLEKLFLARYSIDSMQAAVTVTYISQVFYSPCIALAMMAQVIVGRSVGAQKNNEMGPCIWQFIWFSFLSLAITVPANLLYGNYFLRGSEFEADARSYMNLFLVMNCLYPLGTALSCFFTGQGKTTLIMVGTIGCQFLKIIFGYLFIFGFGFCPSLGILGGALSTIVSHFIYIVLLFVIFINKKNRTLFSTNFWKLRPKLFYENLYPGFLRALSRVLGFASWTSTVH